MTVDIDKLLCLSLGRRQTVSPRDCMLYALGVGLGAEAQHPGQLRYVFERDLQALPSMAITLAYPDLLGAYRDAGIDIHRVLHGEQQFQLHRPLAGSFEVEGRTRVLQLVDKGAGKGLLLYYRTELHDAHSGEALATLDASSFCTADGGVAGVPAAGPPPITRHALPTTPPACVRDQATLPQQALLYRLSGDYNPLHADPVLALQTGHPRPILHGRCTFGIAGHALLRDWCDYEGARMLGMTARFTAPVYPGETVRTEMWPAPGGVLFRARVVERDRLVLDNGFARIGPAGKP